MTASKKPRTGGEAKNEGVDLWVAAYSYEGEVREAVARLKYRNERAVLPHLVDAAVAAFLAALGPAALPDVVTWPPTTRARRRARGFDQAELLARGVARRIRRPATRLLVRRDDRHQTGRDRRERSAGPVFTLARRIPARARPPHSRSVLVVDDVTTTGATLRAAASCLRAPASTGRHPTDPYETVIALTVARTPLKAPVGPPDTGSVQITPSAVTSERPALREDLVRRVSSQLASGTYQAPVDHVVDRLVDAFSPRSNRHRRPAS